MGNVSVISTTALTHGLTLRRSSCRLVSCGTWFIIFTDLPETRHTKYATKWICEDSEGGLNLASWAKQWAGDHFARNCPSPRSKEIYMCVMKKRSFYLLFNFCIVKSPPLLYHLSLTVKSPSKSIPRKISFQSLHNPAFKFVLMQSDCYPRDIGFRTPTVGGRGIGAITQMVLLTLHECAIFLSNIPGKLPIQYAVLWIKSLSQILSSFENVTPSQLLLWVEDRTHIALQCSESLAHLLHRTSICPLSSLFFRVVVVLCFWFVLGSQRIAIIFILDIVPNCFVVLRATTRSFAFLIQSRDTSQTSWNLNRKASNDERLKNVKLSRLQSIYLRLQLSSICIPSVVHSDLERPAQ